MLEKNKWKVNQTRQEIKTLKMNRNQNVIEIRTKMNRNQTDQKFDPNIQKQKGRAVIKTKMSRNKEKQ